MGNQSAECGKWEILTLFHARGVPQPIRGEGYPEPWLGVRYHDSRNFRFAYYSPFFPVAIAYCSRHREPAGPYC